MNWAGRYTHSQHGRARHIAYLNLDNFGRHGWWMSTKAWLCFLTCLGVPLSGAYGREALPSQPALSEPLNEVPVMTVRAPDQPTRNQPTCELKASTGVVLTPGQKVKISWATQRATSATIDQISGAVSLNGNNAFLDDHPSETKIYRMSVVGPGGTAACRISVAVPERIEPLSWPPALLSGMPADYLERARASLAAAITGGAARPMTEQRWVFYATSSLLFEQDMKAVNAYTGSRRRRTG